MYFQLLFQSSFEKKKRVIKFYFQNFQNKNFKK